MLLQQQSSALPRQGQHLRGCKGVDSRLQNSVNCTREEDTRTKARYVVITVHGAKHRDIRHATLLSLFMTVI